MRAPRPLKAPFPYFGGKARIAPIVWQRFGEPANYVEPFAGSCAMLLGRPSEPGIETINDLDGYVANFWRAIQADPAAVAVYADNPVFENDLHARHYWLKQQRSELSARLEADPTYYDPQVAGWWAWGMSCWIGGGFCDADGPWVVFDGQLVKTGTQDGIWRARPHLIGAGQGVEQGGTERKRLQLVGPAGGNALQKEVSGVKRQMPHCYHDHGTECGAISRRRPNLTGDDVAVNARGVARCVPDVRSKGTRAEGDWVDSVAGVPRGRPNIGGAGGGQGTQSPTAGVNRQRMILSHVPDPQNAQGRLYEWFAALANRLSRVRVCCGDWTRVTGPSVTIYNGLTAVFLDPPYDFKERSNYIYTTDTDCSAHVREWALANGDDPLYRICLCGYEGEHDMPTSWECVAWKADGGYANQSNSRGKENRHRERLWFSPHCLSPDKQLRQAALLEVA